MKLGKIVKVHCEEPFYLAEDENGNFLADPMILDDGICVNYTRKTVETYKQNIKPQESANLKEFLVKNEIGAHKVPDAECIVFNGVFVSKIRELALSSMKEDEGKKICLMSDSVIDMFDKLTAVLVEDKSFDSYIFLKRA